MTIDSQLRNPEVLEYQNKLYDLGHQGTTIYQNGASVWVVCSPDSPNPIRGEGSSLIGALAHAVHQAEHTKSGPIELTEGARR